MSAFVSGLSVTAVKSTRISAVREIELDELGARGNRVFCVINERGQMCNGKHFAELMQVVSRLDGDVLTLSFPDGTEASGTVGYGETLPIKFFGHACESRVVEGLWAEMLSEFLGKPVRLVRPEVGVDRGREGAVSVLSRASVDHLAQVAETDSVDVRRFRMLVEVDGVDPYEEDSWVGRPVRLGQALVMMNGNVGRCLITSRDPESAEVNLPTLKLLADYRGNGYRSTEPLPFGIYGRVLERGRVRVGDSVFLPE
jgi:uncharacterized protein YcbX